MTKNVISAIDRHGKLIGYVSKFDIQSNICYVSASIDTCKMYNTLASARAVVRRRGNLSGIYKYNENRQLESKYLPLSSDCSAFDRIHDLRGCRLLAQEIDT